MPTKIKPLPPLSELHRLFRLDHATGDLIWRERDDVGLRWNNRFAGTIAGTLSRRGYVQVSINNSIWHAHRIVFAMATGVVPDVDQEIDHVSGVTDDNRPDGLRLVTLKENLRNQKRYSNNTSGVCGVVKVGAKWGVRIKVKDSNLHLGTFETIEEATAVRKAAEVEHGYHPNHGRVVE